MLAGATILHCGAEIENVVVRPQDAHWLSMDALIILNDERGKRIELHCLLNYFREDKSRIICAGSYHLLAMVSI
jgi:hypothetical protein